MKGALPDREQGRQLSSSVTQHYSLCIGVGGRVDGKVHDTLPVWNIVNIFLNVEKDIL